MQLSELSKKMRDLHISKITLGFDPKDTPVCLCDQQVMGKNGFTLLQHQCGGEDHQDAVNVVLSRATRAVSLDGPVVFKPEQEVN